MLQVPILLQYKLIFLIEQVDKNNLILSDLMLNQ